MNQITKADFLRKKRHTGVAICGTGYSINTITKTDWCNIESKYDTFGMNWFCKSRHPTTWYLIREQCVTPKRIEPEHALEDFIDLMKSFESSCKLIKDMTRKKDNYQHCLHHDKYPGDGYIFNEPDCGCGAKSFGDDIFTEGIHHGKGTIYDALHFAVAMEYEKILFCGIDLYDSRYFYLPYDKTTEQILREGRDNSSPHLMSGKTIVIVENIKKLYGQKMFVFNCSSLLHGILPVWGGE